jgi:hypothetical protein
MTNNDDAPSRESKRDESNLEKSSSAADVKMVSLTPILNKLFFPTAEYIGDEIKSYLKEKIEAAKKKKRDKNIAGHFKAVGEITIAPIDGTGESVQQAEKLEDWIEGAQDVQPDGGELAGLWQKLLHAIVEEKPVERYLLLQAKHLTPLDARLLIGLRSSFGKRPHDRSSYLALRRLESLGFVESSTKRLWLPVILLSLPLIFLVLYTGLQSMFNKGDDNLLLLLMFSGWPQVILLFSQFAFIYLLFTLVWAIYPYFTIGTVRSYSLSPIGDQLVDYVKKPTRTLAEALLINTFSILQHPDGRRIAVKRGVSWPSLFLGPIWIVRHGLWPILGMILCGFVLFSILSAVADDKDLNANIRIAVVGFSAFGWPLYLISLFAIPFSRLNSWREYRYRNQGWVPVSVFDAKSESAAIALCTAEEAKRTVSEAAAQQGAAGDAAR